MKKRILTIILSIIIVLLCGCNITNYKQQDNICTQAGKAFANGVNDKNWFYEGYSDFWGLCDVLVDYELYLHEDEYYLLTLSDTKNA